MDVYFARHNLSGGDGVTKTLKENNLIAYHFLNEYYEDVENYSEQSRGLTQAFNAFHAISKTGCLIAAEYGDSSSFVIAKVKPGTNLKPLTIKSTDGDLIFKTIEFSEPKICYYGDFPLLAAIRPPYTTVCSTGRSFSQLIKHIYLGESLELSVDFMHPSSIELMCEAFLKSEMVPESIRLDYALLRTGKTMPAIDIYGRSKSGNKVYAQVTYSADAIHKVKDLVNFARGTGLTIYFSRDKNLQHEGLTHHFNIDEVFHKFLDSNNSMWKNMIREMIGLKIN